MLIDRATIFVRSGKGGDGCVSLRREKFVPKGGPDGGDGGRGGDVVLVGDASLSTLLPLTPRPHYRAKHGQPGTGKSCHGSDGASVLVQVPLGTLVYDAENDDLLADITRDGERFVAVAGGRGGYGNEHFKSATNQTPREATPGEPAIDRTLRLELKLIAEVGLIGKPNAGKSTLLRAVTRANPKVADYPFTTLAPHLGIAELPADRRGAERRLLLADIPGLIEGAAEGAGLGHDFLRHVERTRVLVHVLDVQPIDGSDPVASYHAIREELHAYSVALAETPEIVVLNKIDLVPEEERDAVVAGLTGRLGLDDDEPAVVTSGATGAGTRELLERCWQTLGREDAPGWSAVADTGESGR
jgi:GTP-binding protein